MATHAEHPASPPASILRNRHFVLLWCAYTTSALGDHLSEMALLDMQGATHRDDSTRISAIIMFAFFLPFFLFGPVMGWLADRLPRKWIMISADLVRFGLMMSMWALFAVLFRAFAVTGWEIRPAANGLPPLFTPWLYAIPLLVTGLFAAMFSPARAALLPTLIRSDQLVRANGLMNAMGPIATIASFLIGGWIVAHYGPKLNFQVDALTFLASAALIFFILSPRRAHAAAVASAPCGRRSGGAGALTGNVPTKASALLVASAPCGRRRIPEAVSLPRCPRGDDATGCPRGDDATGPPRRDRLVDGLIYCRTHRRVIELIAFAVLFWSAAGVVRSIIPALVGHVFGGDIQDIGYYQASLGIGMLSGAFLLALMGEALRSELAISWSLIGAGLASAWLAAVAVLRIGPIAGGIGLFAVGLFGSGVLVSTNALLQRVVPDFFRGRVFGVQDVVTIAGLLLATGVLAIPRWRNIDVYTPLLLGLVAAAMLIGGAVSIVTRLRRGRFGLALTFWRNLTEFYMRLVARVRRDGPCTIPGRGPVILVANHECSIDPLLLVSTSPNRYPSFLIAREYAQIPVVSRLVKLIECIPVNRTGVDTASIKAALRHLEHGRVLGIFPQGRIRRPGEPTEIQEGIGLLALRSGATVIPAHISGTRYSDSVLAPFLRRHRAVVRYGPPVDLSAWKDRTRDRAAYHEVAEHIMKCVFALER